MAERQAARLLLQPWLRWTRTTPFCERRAALTAFKQQLHTPQTTPSSTRPFTQTRTQKKPPAVRTTKKARSKSETSIALDNVSVLIPMTFVAPAIQNWPRDSPLKFARMAYLVLKNRFTSRLALSLHKWQSKPGWRGRALLDLRKAAIVPAARDLHARMHRAFADGDRDELRRVCTQELYERLAGVVDARPRARGVHWEVVRYDQGWRYPRLADDKMAMVPLGPSETRTVRQAIVSIASTQRVWWTDESRTGGGAVVPGSDKTKVIVEHVVLTQAVDTNTWQPEPWRIWGTLPESTLEEFDSEVEAFTKLSQDQSK